MTQFTSGKRGTKQWLVINHDPTPFTRVDGSGRRYARDGLSGGDVYNPRPEFDILDNRILLELRKNNRDIYDLMLDLDSKWRWQFTDREIEHASRVLDLLAMLRRA